MRSEYILRTHPTGPPVPKLRLLGTSWYRRGARYWVRRAGISFGMTFFAAFLVFMLVAFIEGIDQSMDGIAKVVVLGAGGAAILWSICSVVIALRRDEAATLAGGTPHPRGAGSPRRGITTGVGLGAAARGGSPVAEALLFVGLFFAIGWFVVPAVMSFRRYSGPTEKAAVQGVRDWQAQHPDWRP